MTAHDNRGISGWFDDDVIHVDSGITAPGTDSVGAGEKFMLNRSEATELRDRLTGILHDLRQLRRSADRLLQASPPADEPASDHFNRALVGRDGENGVFDYAVGHIDREIEYLQEFQRRVEEALRSTVHTDEGNRHVLRPGVPDGDGGAYG